MLKMDQSGSVSPASFKNHQTPANVIMNNLETDETDEMEKLLYSDSDNEESSSTSQPIDGSKQLQLVSLTTIDDKNVTDKIIKELPNEAAASNIDIISRLNDCASPILSDDDNDLSDISSQDSFAKFDSMPDNGEKSSTDTKADDNLDSIEISNDNKDLILIDDDIRSIEEIMKEDDDLLLLKSDDENSLETTNSISSKSKDDFTKNLLLSETNSLDSKGINSIEIEDKSTDSINLKATDKIFDNSLDSKSVEIKDSTNILDDDLEDSTEPETTDVLIKESDTLATIINVENVDISLDDNSMLVNDTNVLEINPNENIDVEDLEKINYSDEESCSKDTLNENLDDKMEMDNEEESLNDPKNVPSSDEVQYSKTKEDGNQSDDDMTMLEYIDKSTENSTNISDEVSGTSERSENSLQQNDDILISNSGISDFSIDVNYIDEPSKIITKIDNNINQISAHESDLSNLDEINKENNDIIEIIESNKSSSETTKPDIDKPEDKISELNKKRADYNTSVSSDAKRIKLDVELINKSDTKTDENIIPQPSEVVVDPITTELNDFVNESPNDDTNYINEQIDINFDEKTSEENVVAVDIKETNVESEKNEILCDDITDIAVSEPITKKLINITSKSPFSGVLVIENVDENIENIDKCDAEEDQNIVLQPIDNDSDITEERDIVIDQRIGEHISKVVENADNIDVPLNNEKLIDIADDAVSDQIIAELTDESIEATQSKLDIEVIDQSDTAVDQNDIQDTNDITEHSGIVFDGMTSDEDISKDSYDVEVDTIKTNDVMINNEQLSDEITEHDETDPITQDQTDETSEAKRIKLDVENAFQTDRTADQNVIQQTSDEVKDVTEPSSIVIDEKITDEYISKESDGVVVDTSETNDEMINIEQFSEDINEDVVDEPITVEVTDESSEAKRIKLDIEVVKSDIVTDSQIVSQTTDDMTEQGYIGIDEQTTEEDISKENKDVDISETNVQISIDTIEVSVVDSITKELSVSTTSKSSSPMKDEELEEVDESVIENDQHSQTNDDRNEITEQSDIVINEKTTDENISNENDDVVDNISEISYDTTTNDKLSDVITDGVVVDTITKELTDTTSELPHDISEHSDVINEQTIDEDIIKVNNVVVVVDTTETNDETVNNETINEDIIDDNVGDIITKELTDNTNEPSFLKVVDLENVNENVKLSTKNRKRPSSPFLERNIDELIKKPKIHLDDIGLIALDQSVTKDPTNDDDEIMEKSESELVIDESIEIEVNYEEQSTDKEKEKDHVEKTNESLSISIPLEIKKPVVEVNLEIPSTSADQSSSSNENVRADTLVTPLSHSASSSSLSKNIPFNFVKKFKYQFNKLSKSNLEEIVLQKVVEAIVHKSETSELKKKTEEQEQIIQTLRIKMSELTKLYKDLEMVHTRVNRDLEAKNEGLVVPVRITRAVGLQVTQDRVRQNQIQAELPHQPLPVQQLSLLANNNKSAILHNKLVTLNQSTTPPKQIYKPIAASQVASPPVVVQTKPQQIVTTATEQIKKITRTVQKFTPMRPQLTEAQQLQIQQQTQQQKSLLLQQQKQKQVQMQQQQQQLHQNQQNQNQQQMQQKLLLQQQPQKVLINQPLSIAQQSQQLQQILMNRKISGGTAPKTTHILVTPSGIKTTTPAVTTTNQPPRVSPLQTIKKSGVNVRAISTMSNQNQIPSTQMINSQAKSTTVNSPSPAASKSFIDLTDDEDNKQQPTKPTVINGNPPALVAIPGQKGTNNRLTYVINNSNNKQIVMQQQTNRITLQKVPGNDNQYVAITPKTPVQLVHQPPTQTVTQIRPTQQLQQQLQQQQQQQHIRRTGHPAPLPNPVNQHSNSNWKRIPPRPIVRISNTESGIVISWSLDATREGYAEVVSYQIYAYQETTALPSTETWRHVGDVKAMLLPMAVTLTQFEEGLRYYFAVRAVDEHNRVGVFSVARTW